LDFTDALADERGAMPVHLTSDGAHTNGAAVAIIRARIGDYGLLRQ